MIHRFRLPKAVGVLGSVWLSGTAVGQDCGPVWQPMGADAQRVMVTIVELDPDGSGPEPAVLYGATDLGGGTPGYSSGVLRRDINGWAQIGGAFDREVRVLTVFDDDGDGPRPAMLYAAGMFDHVNGEPMSRIARWNGAAWESIGPRISSQIFATEVFDDDGPGPRGAALYIGGAFKTIGARTVNYIARWDGAAWESLGSGVGSAVKALRVFDADGDGPEPARLIAAGQFVIAGGSPAKFIAAWDGRAWSALGSGARSAITALALFDDDADASTADRLAVAGGVLGPTGQAMPFIAVWDGIDWRSFASQPLGGTYVTTMAAFDRRSGLGAGSDLMAVTAYRVIGGSETPDTNVVSWDGTAWREVREAYSYHVRALARIDGRPVAAGRFEYGPGDEEFYGVMTLAPLSSRPVITTQPYGQTMSAGEGEAVWEVESPGPGRITYQWRKDGVPLDDAGSLRGSRSARLTLHRPLLRDAGEYDCVVTNECGGTISEPAALEVLCSGDLNGDGHVDAVDLLELFGWFGAEDARGDRDGDGRITIEDYWYYLYEEIGPC